jgi:hypothetical protein
MELNPDKHAPERAGAHDRNKFEITPAMIDAACDVLWKNRAIASIAPSFEEMVVVELLERALAVAPSISTGEQR